MNKIKLIKSFAGLPIGEYAIDEYNEYYIHIKSNNANIHKDIVEGMKDHFEEIQERPTSWKELGELEGYWVESSCRIYLECSFSSTDKENKNIFKTKAQAEASIALAQITQLLAKYDIPESSEYWYLGSGKYFSLNVSRMGLLRFDTPEKRDHFYKHHKELIDKLAPFYIY